MLKSTSFKKLAVCALMTGLVAAGQSAFAHTEIKSIAVEGNADDNAITIGHGCEIQGPGKPPIPVIAESVVFPTLNPQLIASDGSLISSFGLPDVIDQGGLENLVALIQDKNIFSVQAVKRDALTNVTGFYGKTGSLDINLQGRVPFQFTSPNFSAGSCVTQLNIEVAIADICINSTPTIQAKKVNLWIPDNGSQYSIKGKAAGVDGVGEPAVLQVMRDLTLNNIDSTACPDGGITVNVRPSALDVNTNLGIPGWHY